MHINQKLTDEQIATLKKMRPFMTIAQLSMMMDVPRGTVHYHVKKIKGPSKPAMKSNWERPLHDYDPYVHNFHPDDVVNQVGRAAEPEGVR